MEYVTRVRDASRSSKEGLDVIVNGYHGCIAAACTSGSRKTPLVLKLWLSRAPGFKGDLDGRGHFTFRPVLRLHPFLLVTGNARRFLPAPFIITPADFAAQFC